MYRGRFGSAFGALLAILLIGLIGCGGPTDKRPMGSVKGKIARNSTPVPQGCTVSFIMSGGGGGGAGTAQTAADGSYEIKTLPVGKYNVGVDPPRTAIDPKAAMEASQSKDKTPVNVPSADIPEKYQRPESSPASTEIKQGANTFDLDMKD